METYLEHNHQHIQQFVERIATNLYWHKAKIEDANVHQLISSITSFTFLNRAVKEEFIQSDTWKYGLFDQISNSCLVAPHYKFA